MTDMPKHEDTILPTDDRQKPVWTTPHLDILPLSMTRNFHTNAPTDAAIVPNFS